jgi:mono/diheme cytochrome c family protein
VSRFSKFCTAFAIGFGVVSWFVPTLEGAPTRAWVAPPSAKAVKNPVTPTPKAIADAKQLFLVNCAGCHGERGDGNGPASVVLPRKAANFTDVKAMSEKTDGELFWKMSNGRAPMPAWKELLPTRQRWELVNYLRTFAHGAAPTSKSASP